jgi:hypothetical protein
MMDGLRRAVGRVLDKISTAPLSRYLEDEAGGLRREAGGGSVLTHHGVGEGDAMLPQNRQEAGGGRPEDDEKTAGEMPIIDRKVSGLPPVRCEIEIKKDGEWILCEWTPCGQDDGKKYGRLGSARTIKRGIQIGFNAWEQNDYEFRYYRFPEGLGEQGSGCREALEGAELTRKLRVEVRKAAQREHERREELFYEMLRREIARNGEGLVRYVPDRYELPVPGAMRVLNGGVDLPVKGKWYRVLTSGQAGEVELVISIYERRGV